MPKIELEFEEVRGLLESLANASGHLSELLQGQSPESQIERMTAAHAFAALKARITEILHKNRISINDIERPFP